MSTLTGTKIKDTYPGLMKTADNAALGATEKNIEDGLGNASTLSMGTASASFTGTLDLSGATVTGLPGGAAGLVNGTGTDSLKNADSLVTTPANASGTCSIAIGSDVNAIEADTLVIGRSSCSVTTTSGVLPTCAIAIGAGVKSAYCSTAIGNTITACGFADGCITAIGFNLSATNRGIVNVGNSQSITGQYAVAVGYNNTSSGTCTVRIGQGGSANGSRSVSIGGASNSGGGCSVAIGCGARADQLYSMAFGKSALASCIGDIAIGATTCVTATGNEGSVGIGYAARVFAPRTIALGYVARACNTGSADSIAIGNGASVGDLANTVAAPFAIAIGCGALSYEKSVAIGCTAVNSGGFTVAIGDQANGGTKAGTSVGASTDSGAGSVAIGRNSQATGIHAIAMGGQCNVFSTGCTNASGTAAIAIGTGAAATGVRSISLGENSSSTADQSVAIGRGIAAAKACTVTVCQLHTCGVGLGITMTSPNGTEYVVTVSDTGDLVIT